MARKVTTVFALRDNYTSTMRKAQRATTALQRDVKKMAKALDLENKKRRAIRMENSPAIKAINEVKKKLSPLRETVVKIRARVQNFKRDMAPVTDAAKRFLGRTWFITLKLRDKVSAGLRAIGRGVRTVVGLGAAGVAGGAYVVGKGMDLEKYQMSIGHFVGVNNPQLNRAGVQRESDRYMAWLSQNAKETPFSTGEVIAAGSRAVGVTGGNIDAAQGLVKLAEDMAALTPGKTILDAMEALADAQMGEMERMKEFGFKLTQEQLKAAGGDLFLTRAANGKTILDVFGGGSQKLAQSGSGKWSTVMGNLEDGLAKAGLKLLEAINPLLDLAVTNSDAIGDWFEKVGTDIGTWLTNTLPTLIPKVTKLWDDAKLMFGSISGWVTEKSNMLEPFKAFMSGGILSFFTGGKSPFEGILTSFDSLINTLIGALNSIASNWGTIEPAIAGLVKWLPQLVLAFAGFKLLSLGMTAGKAIGGLFGGAGSLLGKLFGGSSPKSTPSATPVGKPATGSPATPAGGAVPTAGAGAKAAFGGVNLTALFGSGKAAAVATGVTSAIGAGGALSGLYAMYEFLFGNKGKPMRDQLAKANELLPNVPQKSLLSPEYLDPNSAFNKSGGISNLWKALGTKPAPDVRSAPPTVTPPGVGHRAGSLAVTDTAPLIPESKLSEARAKVQTLAADLKARISGGFPQWMKTLLSGGALNATVTINQVINGTGTLNDPTTRKTGGKYTPPEFTMHAAGLMRVPYDNYPALLHRGEAVLPASAAGAYRENNNTVVPQVIINVNGNGRDDRTLADEIMRIAVQRLGEVALNMP